MGLNQRLGRGQPGIALSHTHEGKYLVSKKTAIAAAKTGAIKAYKLKYDELIASKVDPDYAKSYAEKYADSVAQAELQIVNLRFPDAVGQVATNKLMDQTTVKSGVNPFQASDAKVVKAVPKRRKSQGQVKAALGLKSFSLFFTALLAIANVTTMFRKRVQADPFSFRVPLRANYV